MFSQANCLFLAFQSDSHQSLNFWLVIAGILIIFFCMLAVFVPNIKSVITKPQEFNGLGVNMKVSILTVFVLMGFILSMSSFALQVQTYVREAKENKVKLDEEKQKHNIQVAALNAEIKQMRDQEARARKFDMIILIKPEGGGETLNSDEWHCEYQIENSSGEPSEPITASVDRARSGDTLKVFLKDIAPDTRIYRVKLKKGNRVWVADNFFPLREGTFPADYEGEEEESDEDDGD